jgi:hypothetical protein
MTTLTCPKCRLTLPDDALDAGQCSQCGFPLDGPVVLGTPDTRSVGPRLLIVAGSVLLVVACSVGYAFFGLSRAQTNQPAVEVAALPSSDPESAVPVLHGAPLPHELKHPDAGATNPSPPPSDPPGVPDGGPQPNPEPPGGGNKNRPPNPWLEPVKKDAPRPVGVRMPVNPRIEPKRHFDHPDDTADVADLNTGDRVILTGKVRVLLIGSVNGKGVLDASGLVAEEIVIRADLNNEAQVLLHAPRGKVTVRGFVAGSTKLTIIAPGGEVVLLNSGRVAGSALVTVTAKRLEANCPLSGGAKVNVTLTAAGSLKLKRAEEGATVTWKKAAATDPAPTIEKGELRGGAKVVAGN